MKSSYKTIGQYIQVVDIRNTEDKKDNLLGVSVSKVFIKSIANTIGTDFTTYRVVKKNQFTYIPDTSRRGNKIGLALLENEEEGLVSQAYTVFEITDKESLLPEYLMMWFRRPEFDRYARFISHGSVREIFGWDDMCNVSLPIPNINKQKEIVKEYNVLINRIALNNQLIQKLEETAHAIYKQWFVDFEFPDKNGNPYKTNGGKMVESELGEIPKGWRVENLKSLLVLNYGKSLTSNSRSDGTIKVYSSAGVTGFHDKALVNEPSIIIGRKGSIGTVYFETEPFYCIDTAYFIKESDCSLPLIFVYDLLRKLDLQKMDEDSAVPGLSRSTVYALQTAIPDETIINKYSRTINQIYSFIKKSGLQNDKLVTLSNLLLSKLATIEN